MRGGGGSVADSVSSNEVVETQGIMCDLSDDVVKHEGGSRRKKKAKGRRARSSGCSIPRPRPTYSRRSVDVTLVLVAFTVLSLTALSSTEVKTNLRSVCVIYTCAREGLRGVRRTYA